MSIYTVLNNADAGVGSLRAAIISANADPGSTIVFSTIGTITLTSAQLTITANMTISGPGSAIINVQRTAGAFRIFNIGANGLIVNISGITISNGSSTTGAGLFNNTSSTVNLSNCVFDGNAASNGGGILTLATSSLIVNDCTFQNNTASNSGAGISVLGTATLNLNNCTFQNNSASINGGGIYSDTASVVNPSVVIENSLFQLNTATNNGGAIGSSTINLRINNCIIQNNTALNNGSAVGINTVSGNPNTYIDGCTIQNNNAGIGTISDDSNMTINNTTINNNISTIIGGGISSTGTLFIFNSTISNNNSPNTGGISLFGNVSRTIINSTINGNTSPTGGGLQMNQGTLTLINSTISNNSSTGIGILGGSTLTIGNTVVAVNPIGSSPDVSVSTSTITSLGYNFIGNATGTGVAFTQPGDQTGTTLVPIDPFLLPLGNYGGPTQTMLPITFISPLIDAGDNNIVSTYFIYPEVLILGNPIDQRGSPRILDFTVDIGSVESGQVVCFVGKSLVLVKNILSGEISEIFAKNVHPDFHEVFDLISNEFIPIRSNIVNGPAIRFMKIPKNSIKNNQPHTDFFVTSGHKLLIDGQIIKARNIPQAIVTKVKPKKIYSICTDAQTAIMINGLAVMTWSYEKFLVHAKKNNIYWSENKSQSFLVKK